MPWAVAGLALVCLVALVVGQKFGARNNPAPDASQEQAAAAPVAPFAGGATGGATGGSAPPDISQMSPAERAERLYDRIMREAEAGKIENVRTFMPMALAAYDALTPLNLDQRYDVGRIGEVAGDATIARAQADTILRQKPTHLLGLILAAKAERMGKNEAAAKGFDARLRAAEPSERASGLPEYLLHKTDIDAALAAAK